MRFPSYLAVGILALSQLSEEKGRAQSSSPELDRIEEQRDASEAIKISDMVNALRAAASSELIPYSFTEIYVAACVQGTDEVLPSLIDIFASVPDSEYTKGEMFLALADLWLKKRTPEHISPFPEIGNAKRATVAFNRLFEGISRDDYKVFSFSDREYWDTVVQALRGSRASLQGLRKYIWGMPCGTGSEIFTAPHSRALLIALVNEKKWEEAVGSILSIGDGLTVEGELRLLNACCPDPLKIIGTRLADLDSDGDRFYPFWNRMGLLALLLQLDEDTRVDILISLMSKASSEALKDYYTALAKLIPPVKLADGDRNYSPLMGQGINACAVIPVGPAKASQAFLVFCDMASARLPIDLAESLIRVLKEKERNEARPALRKMLFHPSSKVARSAADALEDLNEKVDVPKKLPDLEYTITVNGQPLSMARLEWVIDQKGAGTSFPSSTSKDGRVLLLRDYFLETEAPVASLRLSTEGTADMSAPFFSVLLPTPQAAETKVPLDIPILPIVVHLKLPRPLEDFAKERMSIVLNVETPSAERPAFARSSFSMPVQESLLFNLGKGRYGMEIKLPGTTGWKGTIQAEAGQKAKTIELARASDVSFMIEPPTAWKNEYLCPILISDGKPMMMEPEYTKFVKASEFVFRNLKPGRYVVQIPASTEYSGQVPVGDPGFAATEKSFEIKEDSPFNVDLGTIRLAPATGTGSSSDG